MKLCDRSRGRGKGPVQPRVMRKPDLVYDQCLRIAAKCGKQASAEVEEEYEGSSGDPYRSEHFEGVHPEHFVCEVYVPNRELTVSPRGEVPDLSLVLEPPGG